jgi:hypothetical protein
VLDWSVLGVRPGALDLLRAGVAQLVEQLIRNQQVTRSSRVAGSRFQKKIARFDRSLGLAAM